MYVFRRFQGVHVCENYILPSNFHGLAALVMCRCKYGSHVAPGLIDAIIQGPLSGPNFVCQSQAVMLAILWTGCLRR
jgi:hypothetical protein